LAESRESLRNELEHALLLKEDLELLCEELKTQLSEQKSESENKLAELQESMESLRNELERITIVNGDLQLFYKQLQVQAQAQISDDLERALYKEKESSIISQLNSSLAVAISEISYWQTKVVNLDAQLEELSHHKDRETNEICTLKKALQQARHEIQSLHSELVKETHENENLCEILNSVLFIQVPFRVKTCIASK
jgi:chromosome segregation ATPase